MLLKGGTQLCGGDGEGLGLREIGLAAEMDSQAGETNETAHIGVQMWGTERGQQWHCLQMVLREGAGRGRRPC